ncbi:MAG: hypothetical protein KVP17_001777 [Porospora cf. gigantea B]|uniref:uncharacterized protein n=1 Tax=Porospora cf. gigantea B TaxID=2853592 RepID=UPI00357183F7|nr:MAG: hypothetical protein KVP17_001777 [Porospora cf. gigantea B]
MIGDGTPVTGVEPDTVGVAMGTQPVSDALTGSIFQLLGFSANPPIAFVLKDQRGRVLVKRCASSEPTSDVSALIEQVDQAAADLTTIVNVIGADVVSCSWERQGGIFTLAFRSPKLIAWRIQEGLQSTIFHVRLAEWSFASLEDTARTILNHVDAFLAAVAVLEDPASFLGRCKDECVGCVAQISRDITVEVMGHLGLPAIRKLGLDFVYEAVDADPQTGSSYSRVVWNYRRRLQQMTPDGQPQPSASNLRWTPGLYALDVILEGCFYHLYEQLAFEPEAKESCRTFAELMEQKAIELSDFAQAPRRILTRRECVVLDRYQGECYAKNRQFAENQRSQLQTVISQLARQKGRLIRPLGPLNTNQASPRSLQMANPFGDSRGAIKGEEDVNDSPCKKIRHS